MTSLPPVVGFELERVDWPALRVCGGDASGVPGALGDLLSAESEADADHAYWRLDNRVVVQGGLYESAPPLVPALLAAAAAPVSPVARTPVLDLLVEILHGETHHEEAALGAASLGQVARRAASGGVWLAYHLANHPEAEIRRRAVFIIQAIDADRDRVDSALAALLQDEDEEVRGFAQTLRESDAPEL